MHQERTRPASYRWSAPCTMEDNRRRLGRCRSQRRAWAWTWRRNYGCRTFGQAERRGRGNWICRLCHRLGGGDSAAAAAGRWRNGQGGCLSCWHTPPDPADYEGPSPYHSHIASKHAVRVHHVPHYGLHWCCAVCVCAVLVRLYAV